MPRKPAHSHPVGGAPSCSWKLFRNLNSMDSGTNGHCTPEAFHVHAFPELPSCPVAQAMSSRHLAEDFTVDEGVSRSWNYAAVEAANEVSRQIIEAALASRYRHRPAVLGVDFDVWAYERHDLYAIGLMIFESTGLLSLLGLSPRDILRFIASVDRGYYDNPYHSFLHGFDVFQSVYHTLVVLRALPPEQLPPLELAAILVAALCHDLAHPGVNNLFHVNVQSTVAIRYNDTSVLEHHACTRTFELLHRHRLFRNLSPKEVATMRSVIIKSILATDMSCHFDQMEQLRRLAETKSPLDGEVHIFTDSERQLLLNSVLHMADISNPCRPWELCRKWSDLVVEEFFLQGDLEKSLGLAVSPNMDRDNACRADIAIGFMDFLVRPFVAIIGGLIPRFASVILPRLDENRARWARLQAQHMIADEVPECCLQAPSPLPYVGFDEAYSSTDVLGDLPPPSPDAVAPVAAIPPPLLKEPSSPSPSLSDAASTFPLISSFDTASPSLLSPSPSQGSISAAPAPEVPAQRRGSLSSTSALLSAGGEVKLSTAPGTITLPPELVATVNAGYAYPLDSAFPILMPGSRPASTCPFLHRLHHPSAKVLDGSSGGAHVICPFRGQSLLGPHHFHHHHHHGVEGHPGLAFSRLSINISHPYLMLAFGNQCDVAPPLLELACSLLALDHHDHVFVPSALDKMDNSLDIQVSRGSALRTREICRLMEQFCAQRLPDRTASRVLLGTSALCHACPPCPHTGLVGEADSDERCFRTRVQIVWPLPITGRLSTCQTYVQCAEAARVEAALKAAASMAASASASRNYPASAETRPAFEAPAAATDASAPTGGAACPASDAAADAPAPTAAIGETMPMPAASHSTRLVVESDPAPCLPGRPAGPSSTLSLPSYLVHSDGSGSPNSSTFGSSGALASSAGDSSACSCDAVPAAGSSQPTIPTSLDGTSCIVSVLPASEVALCVDSEGRIILGHLSLARHDSPFDICEAGFLSAAAALLALAVGLPSCLCPASEHSTCPSAMAVQQ
ncbi:hypothetical protein H696_04978 [Fonticula alba]|uniref:Phosphodiesterase n=1 Tax=Fonticula alba TaxID=691883 RepID=A0A058Z351_FONAL|nr:hypothetical protein H696_04978 [Fonticula alba]KCV68690.1 hypothetical protein H696_04978 [Fonticula alba]|eukprot:XP_009497122.1 hypothetical protein H696_04978 [Fonticula alba]